jgi:AAA domain, putative AbiEii toxin, Type IV TA system
MRVARLELTGVGPFEGAVFEIPAPAKGTGELVLFEGPNGCGKTTVAHLVALGAAGACLVDSANGVGAPYSEFLRRIRTPDGGATIAARADAETAELSISPTATRLPATSASAGPLSRLKQFRNAQGDQETPWAAFAYQGHQPTPSIATKGPFEIENPPLRGALSFGAVDPASAYFGQFLVNTEFDRIKAALYAKEALPSEKRDEMANIAEARGESLQRFERVFHRVLNRDVHIEFPFGHHAPDISLDGEKIALDLLGEGMRSTFAWLSDILVRLHRISWADTTLSPLEQDFWLILDEIDESLHPTLQAHIYPALRALFPNARIYATTHSPFVVASVGEGVVFPIRPDKDHKVRGPVKPRPLQPGESLELVTSDVFDAPSGFVDPQTRADIRAHDRDTQSLRAKKEIDWDGFMARRDRLMKLNDEVWTLVAMQEAPVKQEVLRHLRERAAAEESEAHP